MTRSFVIPCNIQRHRTGTHRCRVDCLATDNAGQIDDVRGLPKHTWTVEFAATSLRRENRHTHGLQLERGVRRHQKVARARKTNPDLKFDCESLGGLAGDAVADRNYPCPKLFSVTRLPRPRDR